jgi:hypothetical protein
MRLLKGDRIRVFVTLRRFVENKNSMTVAMRFKVNFWMNNSVRVMMIGNVVESRKGYIKMFVTYSKIVRGFNKGMIQKDVGDIMLMPGKRDKIEKLSDKEVLLHEC